MKEQIEQSEKATQFIQSGVLKTLPQEKRIELLEFRVIELEKLVIHYMKLGDLFQKKCEELIVESQGISEQTECQK